MGLKKVIRISYCSESVKEGGNDSYEWIPNLSGKKKKSNDDAFYLYILGCCNHWRPGIHLTEFVLSYS